MELARTTDPVDEDDEHDDDEGGPVPSGASPALVEAVKKKRVDPFDPETNRREKREKERRQREDDPRWWRKADQVDREKYKRKTGENLEDNPFYNRRFRTEDEFKAVRVVVQFLRRYS